MLFVLGIKQYRFEKDHILVTKLIGMHEQSYRSSCDVYAFFCALINFTIKFDLLYIEKFGAYVLTYMSYAITICYSIGNF